MTDREDLEARLATREEQLAKLRGGLSAEKRAALERRLRGAAQAEPAARPTIPRRPCETEAPTSFAQERLWFLDQLEPGSTVYNIPSGTRLVGKLDLAALTAAFAALVRRHESLRTAFTDRDGQPVQRIAPAGGPGTARLEVIDLGGLPAARREAEAAALRRAEALRPFDLARGPLFRGTLLRLAPAEHVLLLTLHHIVTDGWSDAILMGDLTALYQSIAAGRPPDLPELPVQYADYAVWQRQWLSGERLAGQIDYWRRRLADLHGLDLPLDRPRPVTASFRGAQLAMTLPDALAAALGALGRRHGMTHFMVVLAGFQALLARLSGQTDIAVGTPVGNRARPELERVIGFFVNTLVLRGDLRGEPGNEELLAQVRETALGAYAHQDVPFEKLVEELQPERDLSRNPLFQVMLALQNQPRKTVRLGEIAFEPLVLESGSAKFDLTFFWFEEEGRLRGICEYNTDLFDRTTVMRWAGHYETLLRALADPAAPPLTAMPLLDTAARQQLLIEWNGGPALPEDLGDLLAPIFAQAERRPQEAALMDGERRVTYGDLARLTRRLAHRLIALGVGPGTVVAIAAERSPEMVIAVLGVLAAGAAYLPLDPAYPAERQALMLADAQAAWLLAVGAEGPSPLGGGGLEQGGGQEGGVASGRDLPGSEDVVPDGGAPLLTSPLSQPPPSQGGGTRPRTLYIDRLLADEGLDPDTPLPQAQPGDLAYVIYTSGSTGRPKGVAMTRSAAANMLAWQQAGSLPAPVTLQYASLSFDVSFQEILSTLRAGGRLCLVSEEMRRDAPALLALLEREGVERLFVPFVALRQLAETAVERGLVLPRLREINTAGEQLQITPAIAAWMERLPGCRLQNQYGPSESHLFSFFTLDGPAAGWPALPPVGRPIWGSRTRLLDRGGRAVPIGVAGELYIGGVCLGRGYLDRPQLTAERFVPDPFAALAEEPGARLYRTGDLARFRADGNLDFLGRTDQQVKVRGFRIEPGEIEAVLAGHPELAAAAVVARRAGDQTGGEMRLVAYVVSANGAPPAAAALRDWLAARLPEYMVPAFFIPLAVLPLTPSGKLDRRALPEPSALPAPAGRIAPRTPIEELLAGIWAALLGLAPAAVGIEDSFFELGGHSLLATQVISRVRAACGVDLPLRALFEAPIVAAFAAAVTRARQAAAGLVPPPLVSRERPAEIPLSFAQERLWFLDQMEPGGTAYNLALPVALRGRLLPAALAAAVATLESRHESLRTRFPARGGRAWQEIAPPAPTAALPEIDLSALPPALRDAERDRRVAALVAHRFDLAQGPLALWTLLHLGRDADGEAEHAFVMVQHHIISDGWSMGVMLRELAALYSSFGSGAAEALPPPPLQYADYALWQRELLRAGGLAQQLDYWRERLGGDLPVLALPADRPRSPSRQRRGGSTALALGPDLSARVAAVSRQAAATPFMVLLAAWKVLLHRLSGQDDLLIGMPIAGRNRGETEGTLGFFVNTLVLRTQLGGNPTFAALLAQVREAALGAYDNQDLPFERLVAELQPERDLDRTPLFQVFFNDINFSRDPIAVPGLTLTPLTASPPPSKFDLTVYLAEQPDGFHFALHYDAGLFDRARLEEMPRQLRQLLAAALDAPDLSAGIDDLSLLTVEAAAVLPDPMQILPSDTAATVHDLFARQARLSPSQPAVIDRDETWTYGRLDAAVNRLAHHLIAAGLAPGDVVAVAAERRASLAWAVLGVLKSGCAFLLLDPEYPEARRAAMLRLGGARALVRLPGADLDDELMATITVDGETASRLVEGSWLGLPGEATGCLQDPKERDGQSEPGTVAGIGADPAYVAFTSGSTGEPKAILGTHAPLTHFFAWQAATFDLSTADRFSLLSGLSHDPLLRDLLAPLLLGATLAVPPRASLDDPDRLGAWLAEERVTVLHLTPALGRLLAQGDPHLPALRYAFFGGDRLTAADVARLRRMAPAARVVNFYGATETPQAMGWLKVSDVPDEAPATVPLGAGIDGVQLLVRNGHGGWAGIGELGEIVIRTPYLTRGYLGDDELTRERFLADPQGGTARLYRTGDLGRHRPDGTVEFAGRADRQIKIRGFRIEPAEIEAALTAEPEIAEAVVLAVGRDDSAAGRSDSSRGRSDSAHGRSDAAHGPQGSASGRSDPAPGSQHAALGRGDSARGRDDSPPGRDGSALGRNGSARARDGSLAAFVVLRQGATVGEEELRRRLALRLPSAMIPSAILRVDSLPLTPNRKIDRRALLALLEDAQSDPLRASADGAPRDPIEEVVAGIWAEVLGRGVGGISIHDSFFALGGHSLLATQVLSRLRHIFAVELPLRRLFETPTVAGLAQAVAALRATQSGAAPGTAPPLVPLPREQPAPLSFAQESLWIFEQLSPGTATYNMPVALRLRGPARVDALAAALAEIARRQGSLRTTFAELPGSGPVQVVAPAQDVWAEGSSPLGGGGLEQGGGQEGGVASDRDLPRSEALPERGAPLLTSPLSQPPPSQGGGKRAASGKRAPLPLIDLSALPPERREATAHGLAAAEARRPFELTRGPLWRTRLLRLDGEDHVLLLTTHHILCDGWSMGVLAAELGALYEAYVAGRPSPLPELTVQYADYAAWQRAWLSGAALDAQLDFWRARLHGAPALLELPTDRPRSAERAHRGARLFWQLPEATAAALSAIARRGGATPFMLLLAAFEAVLARHSGQEDLVVGLSIAHRNRVEIEPLVGFFVNMLALRADLGGDPTFERLLEQARATTLEALDHQDLPFERLVAELRPERGLAHSPLFQVLCTLVNVPLAPRLAGLRLEPFATGGQTAHFDLTLSLATGGERWIAGYLEYDTGLFDATTALRLLGHFETLLAAVAEAPGRPLSELPLLGDGERQQLREWNDTAAAFPRDRCVHERIAEQARRTPEALAVAAGDERLTFATLDAAAESLATHLRTLGAGPDSVVALYLERSTAMAVAVLAVWKAGGAFLPLDLADPRERLGWVLQDASPSLLLTRSGLQPRLPKQRGGEGVRVVLLDTPEKRPHPRPLSHLPPTPPPGEGRQEEAEKGREEDLAFPPSPGERGVGDGRGAGGEGAFPEASGALPDHLAYIIYTSGSTGRPKGTMIPHRGVMNYLSWAVAAYRVEEGCGAPVHTPLAFDLTMTSLLAPWLAGRCAVLVSEEEGVAGLGLALAEPDAVTAAGFSLVKLTPAHLPLLAEQPGAVAPGRTRALVIGGEALNGERLAPWRRAAPDTRVINEYGPTETVVGCCVYEAPAGALGEGPVPIGRPIANAGLYVVDRGLQPVPLGTPGELLIGGAGLARGYLRRPDLTAERFVPDALSGEAGARLYRTGDRVRQHPDGLLEVVGRLDDQVKIRGFRIELGEVEAALASHSSLAAAAVAAWPGPSGKRLVAYVVPHPEEEAASVGELRRHLRARLPEHMLPAAFVTLPALPLTANGKVDRRALPAPPEEEPPPAPTPEAIAAAPAVAVPDSGEPRTEVEKALAEIWAQLLRLPRVGIQDNFFELGGDSILSLQMASRARAAGLRLKSRDVFQHQTVAQLAAVVQVLPAAEPSAPAASVSQEVVPLTPIQRWFFELGHAEPAHYNQSLLLLLRRPTSPAILAAAAAHLVVHHEALRLRFEPRQRIAPPEPWAPFSVVDLSRLAAPAEAIEAAAAALQGSLDLAAGPLLRLAHFDLGPGAPGRLLVIIHHLAVDGVSWRILLEDLETACAALERGEPVRLPEPPTPFQRWAARLQDLARAPELAAELPYWLAEERTRIAPLPLDGMAAPAADLRHATRYVTASLDETETEALLRRVPADLESRIEELLLAAVALACRRWTGSPALLVDLEGHGREAFGEEEGLDLSRTVGWLTTIAPVLLDLSDVPPETGARGAVPAVRRQLRAMPRRGAGFGVLRYPATENEEARRLADRPAAPLLFNYFGQLDAALPVDSRLSAAPESAGPHVSPRNRRSHSLQIDAAVSGGRLSFTWSYSAELHRAETIERLAAGCLDELRRLAVPRDAAPAEIAETYPLTPMQQGILFHSRLAAGPAENAELYVAQYDMTLRGALDLPAFRGAWQGVIDRHAVLRTGFQWEGLDRPQQEVRRSVAAPLTVLDWSGVAEEERAARLAELLRADRRRGFDSRTAPLLRVTLVRLGEDEHRMVFSFHHLLLDGWSMPLLFGELLHLYEALRRGVRPELPPVRPFRDYVEWLAQLNTADREETEAFWRRELAGFTMPTPVPLEARPVPGSAADYTRRHHLLTAAETVALQRLARRGRVTLGTLAQGAWALLLAHHSGSGDVLFGATSSGRPPELEGAESMLGLFIATLPVRAGVDPAAPLFPWLEALQQRLARLRELEHCPLTEIQSWSELPRGTPLFHSLMIFENYPADPGAGAATTGLRLGGAQALQNTNYPLNFVAALRDDRLLLRLAFDAGRHLATPIERALSHLVVLLRALGEASLDGDGPALGTLPILDPAERHQLLHEWSGAVQEQDGPPLHHLFERTAAATPTATALIFEDQSLSYSEVDARAGRLAADLRRQGIGPETLVALALPRSPWLPIAMLAVWKAGGAFLPIDPSYPQERRDFMLADSGAALLLGPHPRPLSQLPPSPPPGEGRQEEAAGDPQDALLFSPLPGTGRGELGIGANFEASHPEGEERAGRIWGKERSARPDPSARPSRQDDSRTVPLQLKLAPMGELGEGPGVRASLAYVIYTSGSTGTPKGVMIEHRGLANLVREQIAAFGITAESRVLQLASASFDASVSEIWTAWVAGAALVMLPEEAVAADEGLVRRLRDQAVSVATFPPSLLAALPPAELPALATLVVAGEAANAALLARWAPGRERILNAYGPTEITVCATVERWDPETGGEPLLGRPIANTRVRLLSLLDESEPAAIGAVGEIGLSGIGLARGYLRRPERTAASFVPDPWSESPGGRLYRTGDLARWTGDGRLAYLGRRDGQVKVRGFRIETGEVEAALARHPEVQACAVAARRDQLVAYVVPAGPGGAALTGRLRAFLQSTLPEALVPGRFVDLPALPCTPSGKLDRRALPDPEAVVRERSAPPRTDLERYLAGVWSEILGVQEIGIDDDFFQLGGHSLSGATVVGRLQKDLGEIVHVVVMYDAPTVGRLAVYLTAHYPEAVARLLGTAPVSGPAPAEEPPVTEADLAELRRIVAGGRSDRGPHVIRPRNPPALFVLSAPRSGSTLLRVMLAGHPLMFAPPELELLSFETLAERRAAFAGRNSFWLEGAVRALMEIERCDADQAEATVAALEAEGATPQDLYRRMQERIVPRLLIDKTPSYALDPEVPARAERWFDGARYLHLVRHPTAMIRSFEEARLDQVFFRFPHRFSRRRLAELIWSVSEANIQAFLAGVEPERHYLLRYEELVADPEAELRRLCGWLEIDFHPAMAQPYENRESRMTDGIHPWSRMLGDVKFHEHRAVDPAAAERWRREMQGHVLGRPTLDIAERLGYAAPSRPPLPPALVSLKASGSLPPLLCIHPAGGDVLCYRDLAQALDGERPVYGLQAHGVAPGETPLAHMEEIAERSLTVLRAAFPSGPYHLLGWSFGGLVAYEIARRLTAAGEEVALLAVLDAGPKPKQEEGEARPNLDAADLLADEFRAVLAVTAEEIRALPEGERLPWLFSRAEAVGKLPAGLDLAYVERLLATFQAHQQAALAYRPGPYPGRLTLFRAVGDLASRPDLAMGWNGLAADLEIVKVPGGHEDMVAPPHLETLAAKLRELLARGETR